MSFVAGMPRHCLGQCCNPNQGLIPGHLIPRHDTLREEFESFSARGEQVPHLVYSEVNAVLPIPLEATRLTAAASAHWIEYLLTRLTPAGFDLVSDRIRQLILFRVSSPSGLRSNPQHNRRPSRGCGPADILREETFFQHQLQRVPTDLGPTTYPPPPPRPSRTRGREERRRSQSRHSREERFSREAAQQRLEEELAAASESRPCRLDVSAARNKQARQ